MKKISFIIFLFILIITITYLSQKDNLEVENKEIITSSKQYNSQIYYPKFNIKKLDNYIKNFINDISIQNYSKKGSLFVDYDYYKEEENIVIKFYVYNYYDNIVKQSIQTINYNISKNSIFKNTNILKTDYNYDIVHNKVIDSNAKLIAFTFDDGPSYNTVKIVNTLKKYDSTATFFVMGNKVSKYKKTIKYLNDNNMEIGNHTYSHVLLTKLKKEDVKEEIEKTQKIIYNEIGKYPKLFRPSYGTVSRKIKKISPLPLIIWSIDTLDWKYHNSRKIANKILSKVKNGDIILMHDTYTATFNAVNIVIPKLKEMGYEIVSVSELFYYKNKTPNLGYYYGSIN